MGGWAHFAQLFLELTLYSQAFAAYRRPLPRGISVVFKPNVVHGSAKLNTQPFISMKAPY